EFWFLERPDAAKGLGCVSKDLGCVSVPKLAVVIKVWKDRIGPRRLHQGKQRPEHGIDRSGGMPHVKIGRVKRGAQGPFAIVVETAAVESFVAVRDSPFDDIVKNAIVKIELEGDGIVESNILVTDAIALHGAQAERDDMAVLTPYKKSDLVRNPASDVAKE